MSILRNLVIVMGASIVCTSAPAALVNLGDGTVKDEASNLIWLKDWDQLGADTWFNQSAAVDALAFAGSSDWRLPTIDEYLALWAQVGSTTAGLQSHFDDVQPTSINDIRLFHWSSEPVPAPPRQLRWLVLRVPKGRQLAADRVRRAIDTRWQSRSYVCHRRPRGRQRPARARAADACPGPRCPGRGGHVASDGQADEVRRFDLTAGAHCRVPGAGCRRSAHPGSPG
jgi:hypothetical protein